MDATNPQGWHDKDWRQNWGAWSQCVKDPAVMVEMLRVRMFGVAMGYGGSASCRAAEMLLGMQHEPLDEVINDDEFAAYESLARRFLESRGYDFTTVAIAGAD